MITTEIKNIYAGSSAVGTAFSKQGAVEPGFEHEGFKELLSISSRQFDSLLPNEKRYDYANRQL